MKIFSAILLLLPALMPLYSIDNSLLNTQTHQILTQLNNKDKIKRGLAAFKIYIQSGNDQENREIDNGLELIIRPTGEEVNQSLELLLLLLAEGISIQGDTITIALASANNYIYTLADAETKKLIIIDIKKHLKLYKRIAVWQKENNCLYSITNIPVIAKTLWADRTTVSIGFINTILSKKRRTNITSDIYTEFIDSIETYEQLHNYINNQNLFTPYLTSTAALLESHVASKLQYRTTMEFLRESWKNSHKEKLAEAEEDYKKNLMYKTIMGVEFRWDHRTWLNHQFKMLIEEDKFMGTCTTGTAVAMGFYKAAGIAPLSLSST